MPPRPLTTTIALVLVLAVSGCGKDDSSDTSAQSAATATQAGDAANAGSGVGTSTGQPKKSSASKTSSGSKTPSAPKTESSGSTASKPSGSKSSGGSKKRASGSTPSSSKTPATAAGGTPSNDNDAKARLAVVATVRRYQKDFIDGDGTDACLLLTRAGKQQMNAGGRGRTCAESVKRILDQAHKSDIELIKDTRAGIHVDDVTIRGDDATVRIGKDKGLRLVRQGGRWLVDDPSP